MASVPSIWSERVTRVGRAKIFLDQDRRKIHDSQHQRVQSRRRGLEWIRVLRNVSCVAREVTCPTGIGSSSRRSGLPLPLPLPLPLALPLPLPLSLHLPGARVKLDGLFAQLAAVHDRENGNGRATHIYMYIPLIYLGV